ncbi:MULTISPECIES: hypothetical protein [unclassified Pseudomonas]|uniref:hypothetical protein n=1 Tax=unclassified Pseudomonas TaxID=196821 RepID=UPI002097BBBE|nr:MULTISPECIES: hypothetical protein [unclassified Pseudomonas]MCO7518712.1 hypothetical protein [Pseudomonas sp. 1]MCO7540853.1 hypothetical protein [Pseudomonas sp. VA159-2]
MMDHKGFNELHGIQMMLTSTAGALHKLANGWERGSGLLSSLGERLKPEQRELLRNAAQLIDSIGHTLAHAKEKHVRSEKDAKRRQDARMTQSKQLVAMTYPLPAKTQAQRLEILQAALILNRARQFYTSYSTLDFNLYLRNGLAAPERLHGASLERYRSDNLRSLRYTLIDDVTHHLAYDDGCSVVDRLRRLQEKVADAVAQTPLTAQERETLRLWKEAFCADSAKHANAM